MGLPRGWRCGVRVRSLVACGRFDGSARFVGMTRKSVRGPWLGAVAALALLLSGCALGNSATVSLTRSTTIGQELIDLKKAFDEGVISDSDYAQAKQAILRQADWEELAKRKDR
jgi:hypothetical protein